MQLTLACFCTLLLSFGQSAQIAPPAATAPAPTPQPRFVALFDGTTLTGWVGDTAGYKVQDGAIHSLATGSNLFTKESYADFHLKLEFRLTPGANSGIGIRAPLTGDVAYEGMEIQMLDNTSPKYAKLAPWQYHGSIYGVVPAKREHLKPVGEWNQQEIIVRGSKVQVILNGKTIVDADISKAADDGTIDGKPHPGLRRQGGHIGFLGHGDCVSFRNIEILELQ
ncbi:MAG: DUF1080 domain-containing protein [Phycisphaerales bacterium]|nr:DUF1080 domain-containing protein [Phycisphaerales bacterium]